MIKHIDTIFFFVEKSSFREMAEFNFPNVLMPNQRFRIHTTVLILSHKQRFDHSFEVIKCSNIISCDLIC